MIFLELEYLGEDLLLGGRKIMFVSRERFWKKMMKKPRM